MIKVASVHFNLLPYHVARYRATRQLAADRLRLYPVLLRHTTEYAQIAVSDMDHETKARRVESGLGWRHRLFSTLADVQPDVVLLAAGYGQRDIITVLDWATSRSIPVVLCSDSQEHDAPRVWWRERIKSLFVRSCTSYFAAGSRHVDYLVKLGAERERITVGLDVVDNAHFSSLRGDARAKVRGHFLTCARLVEKKNLATLILAYARYVELGKASAEAKALWRLVIAGDGPLRPLLEQKVNALGLQDFVDFAGFVPYPDLPRLYAEASAFILPSTVEQWGLVVNEAMAAGLPVLVSDRCGCATELVHDASNGFTFAPDDPAVLAALMVRLWTEGPEKMGAASREIIRGWDVDRFVAGIGGAVDIALRSPRRHIGPAARLLLRTWRR